MDSWWTGRPVVVAGGTGFIGSALVRRLSDAGASVLSASRSAPPMLGAESSIVADLTNPDDALRACHEADTVFLAAALDGNAVFKATHAAELIRVNSLITLNVLQAARDLNVRRVVLVSSSEVYASGAGDFLSDEVPLDSIASLNPYALSKVFGEVAALKYIEQFRLGVSIARPANVYGPGDDPSPERGRVIARWVANAAAGRPLEIWGTGDERRSYIYIADLVDGLLALGRSEVVGRPVNFAHPVPASLREIADAVTAARGREVDVVYVKPQVTPPRSRVLDTSFASSVLGYTPKTSLTEGIGHATVAFGAAPRRP